MSTGIVYGSLSFFCLLFLLFAVWTICHQRKLCTEEEQESPDLNAFDWSVLTTDVWKDLQKCTLLSPPQLLCSFLPVTSFVFVVVLLSCPMAPAHRLYPTVSGSPPSSARTHRPPSTTPPGCGSSRSGSGPASPPSSKPPKSLPQSVNFTLPCTKLTPSSYPKHLLAFFFYVSNLLVFITLSVVSYYFW